MKIAIELRTLKAWEEVTGRLLAIDIPNRRLHFDTIILLLDAKQLHCIPDLQKLIGKRVSLLRTDSIIQPYHIIDHSEIGDIVC